MSFNFNTVVACLLNIVASASLYYTVIVNTCIKWISNNFCESQLSLFVPQNSANIVLYNVEIDGVNYTSRFSLMIKLNWHNDIAGITTDDILLVDPNAKKISIIYHNRLTGKLQSTLIDLCNDTKDGKDILFGEISMV